MKLKQKAEIQRLLGNIEGATVACEENAKDVIVKKYSSNRRNIKKGRV